MKGFKAATGLIALVFTLSSISRLRTEEALISDERRILVHADSMQSVFNNAVSGG